MRVSSDRRPSRPLRLLLAAFGDAGHAFPMIALGEGLRARGHDVCLETWSRWRPHVEAAGLTFAPAPEYPVFPTPDRPLHPYEATVRAARETRALVARYRPDACIADVLTVAPSLAAELEGVRAATLVPHIFPMTAPGAPVYALGARAPRTRLGARLWQSAGRLVLPSLELGRTQLNESRRRVGLPPSPHIHTGLSRDLTLVGTFPHLEYPREWPSWTRLVGPLMWEPPSDPVAPPPGDGPVVLIAPSTAQDPQQQLLRVALEALAGEPVRVIAVHDPQRSRAAVPAPANAVLVPWLSYARTMPACDLVITHGGHGTVVRALSSGCALVVCPAGGDMGENAARVDWAGVGVRLPRRLLNTRNLRLAVRRALGRPALRSRVDDLAQWSRAHDAKACAAREVERWLAPSL